MEEGENELREGGGGERERERDKTQKRKRRLIDIMNIKIDDVIV